MDGHYLIKFSFCELSRAKFSILVICNRLLNLYSFLLFIIPLWVQIGMNHTLLHPIMMTLLIKCISTLLKEEWARISMNHTPEQLLPLDCYFQGFQP